MTHVSAPTVTDPPAEGRMTAMIDELKTAGGLGSEATTV
jgi:hypothetical protein